VEGGWIYRQFKFKDLDIDKDVITSVPWRPHEITLQESVLIRALVETGVADTLDEDLTSLFERYSDNINESVERLVGMGLLVRDGTKVRPLHDTIHVAITPDGKFLASPNGTQLTSYIAARFREK